VRFKHLLTSVVIVMLLARSSRAQEPEHLSSEQLAKRTIHRRAVDAAIWGQPIVSFDAMRQAYFRDAKANYNDVIWWPKGAGWKNQSLTVNTSVRYLYFFFNTRNDGPVVLELPGAIDGAGFFGTITDAWFVPLVDIGSQGEDNGKGGKYLVLPPQLQRRRAVRIHAGASSHHRVQNFPCADDLIKTVDGIGKNPRDQQSDYYWVFQYEPVASA